MVSPNRTLVADVVFVQLPKGRDELRAGLHGLSPRARQLLQLLDGKRSAVQLQRVFPEPELAAYLSLLEIGDFIVAKHAKRGVGEQPIASLHALSRISDNDELSRLRKRLLIAILSRIGPAAEAFALAITRAETTDDLRRLIPAMTCAVEVSEGPDLARQFALEMAQQ